MNKKFSFLSDQENEKIDQCINQIIEIEDLDERMDYVESIYLEGEFPNCDEDEISEIEDFLKDYVIK